MFAALHPHLSSLPRLLQAPGTRFCFLWLSRATGLYAFPIPTHFREREWEPARETECEQISKRGPRSKSNGRPPLSPAWLPLAFTSQLKCGFPYAAFPTRPACTRWSASVTCHLSTVRSAPHSTSVFRREGKAVSWVGSQPLQPRFPRFGSHSAIYWATIGEVLTLLCLVSSSVK